MHNSFGRAGYCAVFSEWRNEERSYSLHVGRELSARLPKISQTRPSDEKSEYSLYFSRYSVAARVY